MQTFSRMAGSFMLALALSLPAATQSQTTEATKASPPQAAQDTAKEQQKRTVDQPGNNAPVWREVRSGQPNYASIPGREAGVLIQPSARFPGQDAMTTAGEAWRKFRNGPVTFYGGWIVIIVLAILAGIYFALGPIKLHERPSGRMILRFTTVERWTHWIMGISFVALGLSGLIILFGKHVLLPILGYTLFAWLTGFAKNLHNFVAPLFIVTLPIFIAIFVKDNFPEKGDLRWLLNAWKMFGGHHLPSGRFNAGEKLWFWGGVVFLSLILCASGVVLLFPNFEQLRATMQQAHIIHVIAAVFVIAAALGHIYLGTIGMEGAYRNMRDGVTDETWAKEHHEYWYNDVKAGKAPGDPAAAKPAGAPQAQH